MHVLSHSMPRGGVRNGRAMDVAGGADANAQLGLVEPGAAIAGNSELTLSDARCLRLKAHASQPAHVPLCQPAPPALFAPSSSRLLSSGRRCSRALGRGFGFDPRVARSPPVRDARHPSEHHIDGVDAWAVAAACVAAAATTARWRFFESLPRAPELRVGVLERARVPSEGRLERREPRRVVGDRGEVLERPVVMRGGHEHGKLVGCGQVVLVLQRTPVDAAVVIVASVAVVVRGFIEALPAVATRPATRPATRLRRWAASGTAQLAPELVVAEHDGDASVEDGVEDP